MPTEITVDLMTNTLSRDGASMRVPPKVAEVLHTLVSEWPAAVSFERLERALAGPNEVMGRELVYVHVSNARRAARRFGFEIKNQTRVGWRLEQCGDGYLEVHLPPAWRSALTRIAQGMGVSIDEVVRRQLAPLMENGR